MREPLISGRVYPGTKHVRQRAVGPDFAGQLDILARNTETAALNYLVQQETADAGQFLAGKVRRRERQEIRAVTIVVVSCSATAPMLPMGSSSATSGSHWTSSGSTAPSGSATGTIIAMAASGTGVTS
ncbi:MAG: hypothetical protein M3Y90_08730 [Actinomycetota bacterium]|nr:hypothetical protein [Actinomycetota bacterium]